MPQPFEIRLERQFGGSVWAVLFYDAEDTTAAVVGQSSEAFATEESAYLDAQRFLVHLYARPIGRKQN